MNQVFSGFSFASEAMYFYLVATYKSTLG